MTSWLLIYWETRKEKDVGGAGSEGEGRSFRPGERTPQRAGLQCALELFAVNRKSWKAELQEGRGSGVCVCVCVYNIYYRLVRPAMIKSLSVSSESSLPALEDDIDSVCSDELLGSQSRRWLSDIMTGDMSLQTAEEPTVDLDGLFVDRRFPLGELEMLPAVKWKRPKVTKKKLSIWIFAVFTRILLMFSLSETSYFDAFIYKQLFKCGVNLQMQTGAPVWLQVNGMTLNYVIID